MKHPPNISPGLSLTQAQGGNGMVGNVPIAHSTVMAVLLAISFAHLLNDTIQALLPSIYPMAPRFVPSELRTTRLDHVHVSMHGVVVSTARRHGHR